MTGIVGVVQERQGFIEISRLSGADVDRIEVTAGTIIRRAGGDRIDLSAIEPSDRIIAEGRLTESGEALIAFGIEVQELRPRTSPGG